MRMFMFIIFLLFLHAYYTFSEFLIESGFNILGLGKDESNIALLLFNVILTFCIINIYRKEIADKAVAELVRS